jgi:hypothetical protein
MGGGYQGGNSMQGYGGPSCNPQHRHANMVPLSFGHCGLSIHCKEVTTVGVKGQVVGTKALATIVH